MLVWVVYIPQRDGSFLVQMCPTPEAAASFVGEHTSYSGYGMPIDPVIGSRITFNLSDAYAVLGQVRFD